MNKALIIQAVVIFIIVQAIGLFIAQSLIEQDIHAEIINDNPDDLANTLGLIAYILAFTVVLLIAIRFLKRKSYWFLKAFELLAVWGASLIVFSILLGDLIGLALAIAIVVLRIALPKSVIVRNAAAMLAVIGAGALIGVSLGIIPIVLFVAALSAYDFIAVFKTKHLVSIAKAVVDKNLAFTIAMPTKEHKFELGTGDLVIPLVFASAALGSTISAALFVLTASLAGLLLTMDYSSKNLGKALPALPLQGIFMIIAFGIAKLAGF